MTIAWTDSLERIDWAEAAELYRIAPLGTREPAALETVYRNSMYKRFAFEGGRLVAAGRVLADGADCAYLCDVVVHPKTQGLGLGRALIEHLMEQAKGHKKIILYAAPGKEPVYEKFGFRRMKTAMAVFQDPESAAARGLTE